jgi:hypothetical protein
VIFAGLLIMVVLTFVWNSLVIPAMASYGDEHAQIVGQALATYLNALALEDEGLVFRELGKSWDVRVFHESGDALLTVSHGEFDSGEIRLFHDCEDFEADGIYEVYVVKEPDKIPRLSRERPGSPEGDGEEGG